MRNQSISLRDDLPSRNPSQTQLTMAHTDRLTVLCHVFKTAAPPHTSTSSTTSLHGFHLDKKHVDRHPYHGYLSSERPHTL
jgi:hypothetical protein